MATSNVGEAIGNSKELNVAAALFDRKQARQDAKEAADQARAERLAASQQQRDEAKLDRISRWITVDENAIHPYWQPEVQQQTAKFWANTMDKYDKNPGYLRTPQFNAEWNQMMAQLGQYKQSSEQFSKDLLLTQQKPDDWRFKDGFKEAVESGDANKFQAYWKSQNPSGTYTTGQGVVGRYNLKKGIEKATMGVETVDTIERVPNVDPSLVQKGKIWVNKVHEYNPDIVKENLQKMWANNYDNAQSDYPNPDDFIKAHTPDGRYVIKSELTTTAGQWAPKASSTYGFTKIGGLAIGQTANNGSWAVTHTDKAASELKITDPKTGKVRSIDATDVYQFDNVSNSSEGQDKSFTVGAGAIELNSGEKITGNTVRGKLEAIVKTSEVDGADKDGYSVIVLGPPQTTEQIVNKPKADGTAHWVKVKVTDQARYMVPYEPNAGKVQGMTLAKADPDGFSLKDKSKGAPQTTVVTTATGQTKAPTEKKKAKAAGNKSVNPDVKNKADALFGGAGKSAK